MSGFVICRQFYDKGQTKTQYLTADNQWDARFSQAVEFEKLHALSEARILRERIKAIDFYVVNVHKWKMRCEEWKRCYKTYLQDCHFNAITSARMASIAANYIPYKVEA